MQHHRERNDESGESRVIKSRYVASDCSWSDRRFALSRRWGNASGLGHRDDALLAALLNSLCMDIIWKTKALDMETIFSQAVV